MFKALVCDIDDTLADGVSWYKITEALGASTQEHQTIFESYLAGSITYQESKERLLGLWSARGRATKDNLSALFEDWQLREGAYELFAYARQRGWSTALITGSVDLFAEITARKLSVSNWYANTRLVWSQDGQLVDYDYEKEQSAVKLRQLNDFTAESHISINDCIVIGDGDNDMAMFTVTGNGIAVGDADESLVSVAWKHVENLHEISRLLKEI